MLGRQCEKLAEKYTEAAICVPDGTTPEMRFLNSPTRSAGCGMTGMPGRRCEKIKEIFKTGKPSDRFSILIHIEPLVLRWVPYIQTTICTGTAP